MPISKCIGVDKFTQASILHQQIVVNPTTVLAKELADKREDFTNIIILAGNADFNKDVLGDDADSVVDIFHAELSSLISNPPFWVDYFYQQLTLIQQLYHHLTYIFR